MAVLPFVSERVDGRRKKHVYRSRARCGVRVRTPYPRGTLNVVDPHPLNWLYFTWNTMEEPVRTDEKGNIVGAAMEDSFWEGATLVVKVREGVRFQDGTTLAAQTVRRAFDEVRTLVTQIGIQVQPVTFRRKRNP